MSLIAALLPCALLTLSCRAGLSTHPLGDGGATRDAPNLLGAVTGTAGCAAVSACASGVCMPDVTGDPRCCETDCRASGRVCSTGGACVCAGEAREVGGACLLVEGRSCRESRQCASNHCID